MKGMKKVLSTLMIALLLVSVAMPVFATTTAPVKVDVTTPTNLDTTKISQVLGLIKVLGIFLAVGILMVMGIKYMMGSVEEKAEYKKTIIPFVVGVVLLIAAATIIQIIQSTVLNVV